MPSTGFSHCLTGWTMTPVHYLVSVPLLVQLISSSICTCVCVCVFTFDLYLFVCLSLCLHLISCVMGHCCLIQISEMNEIKQHDSKQLNTAMFLVHCKWCTQMSNLWHVYVTSRQSFIAKYHPIFILFPTLQHNLQQVAITFEEMWILNSCTQTQSKSPHSCYT